MPLIAIEGVRKSFGALEVLRGVDLAIESGEVVAIIGRSGSGKTTLLRCLNGLEVISHGMISIAGEKLGANQRQLRRIRRHAGMIFQQFNLFPHLSAGQNVMLAQMVVAKRNRTDARDIARRELERVGLSEKFNSYPDELSGGQKQRVAIARALAMEPGVLLCDEITSALDPELVSEVLAVIQELAAQGMTLVMVTHEMHFARRVASKVVFMHRGLVHEAGKPEQIFGAPATPELRQFLGSLTIAGSRAARGQALATA